MKLTIYTLRDNHNNPVHVSFLRDIIYKIIQQMQTLYLLGLSESHKNYTFVYYYTNITYYYTITMMYANETGFFLRMGVIIDKQYL